MPSSKKQPKTNKTKSLTHTGQTTSESIQSQLMGKQKNVIGTNFYAQNLFSQPYENGFQFISLNKGLTHKAASFETPLLEEVDKNTTINFDAEEEPFQADDLDTFDK